MGNVEAAIRYYSLGKLVHQERVMTCIARKFVSMAVEATQQRGCHGGSTIPSDLPPAGVPPGGVPPGGIPPPGAFSAGIPPLLGVPVPGVMFDVGRLVRWAARLGPVVGLQAFRMVTELLHKNLIPRQPPPPHNNNAQLLTHSYQHQQGHHTHLQTASPHGSSHGPSVGTGSHVNYTQRNIITETEFGEIIAMG